MYKVIKHFCDLQDKNHSYNEGDIFPREGLEVSEERLAELAGSQNRQGTPLIKAVEEVAPAQLEIDVSEVAKAVEAAKEAADNAIKVEDKTTKKGTKKAAEK